MTETYKYDADGSQLKRTVTPGSTTTICAFGMYEQEGAITRKYYTLAGQVIAVRDSVAGLSYIHGNHVDTVSISTSSSGVLTGMQYFDARAKSWPGT